MQLPPNLTLTCHHRLTHPGRLYERLLLQFWLAGGRTGFFLRPLVIHYTYLITQKLALCGARVGD